MAAPDTINIITTQLAAGRGPDQWERRTVEKPTPVANLKQGMSDFLAQVESMLGAAVCKPLGDFQLEEIAFTAEVNPDGLFKLVGTGAAETVGGVRFTLKRKHTVATADLVRHLVGTEPVDDPLQNKFKSHEYVRGEADGQHVLVSNYVRGENDGQPVRVEVTGTVPVAEQNLPLPVVEA